MADPSIFEKYPGTWRLDHSDFADVSKTHYAKGVVSDFKVDDPNDLVNTIQSMVKVTGGFGESDWIPLFYHPKVQYWDDLSGSPLATDFDEEGRYFDRAWMSFRVGDEVAVMLKEGTPVAVIGFADGKPKVGEDIVKLAAIPDLYQPDYYYSMASGGLIVPSIDSSELGPDGLPLKLTEQVPYIEGGVENRVNDSWFDTDTSFGVCYSSENPIPPPPGWTALNYYKEDYSIDAKIGLWRIVIGPILYVFLGLITRNKTEANIYTYVEDIYIEAVNDWCYAMAADPNLHDVPPPVAGDPTEEPTIYEDDFTIIASQMYAGIYSEELLNSIPSLIGGISPLGAYDDMGAEWLTGESGLFFQGSGGLIPATLPSNVKLYYKSHN